MTTGLRLRCLCGWSVRCASMALALIIAGSAFADPTKNVVVQTNAQPPKKVVKKVCYTYISGQGMPQPCDRLGPIPTTANMLYTLGNHGSSRD